MLLGSNDVLLTQVDDKKGVVLFCIATRDTASISSLTPAILPEDSKFFKKRIIPNCWEPPWRILNQQIVPLQ